MTPTARTLAHYRRLGIPAAVVERWIKIPGCAWGGKRKDCFGFDVLVAGRFSTDGIQAGSASSHAAKVKYALALPEVRQWLQNDHRRFFILTWGQRVIRNKTGQKSARKRWTPRFTEIIREEDSLIAVNL